MDKKRKSGRHLSPEQVGVLSKLTGKKKALEAEREKASRQKKTLSDKLEENLQKRRKNGECWFVPYDRLYNWHGVKREDYYKRTFSGGPIDKICSETIALLQASDLFFSALLKDYPTDAEIDEALRLILEQFVERNHQDGKRLDEQSKRIVGAETMANTMAKRKALHVHGLVNKRISYVHDDTRRGKYKKKSASHPHNEEDMATPSPVPGRAPPAVTPSAGSPPTD
mmetsp:Transcript_33308/g.56660  ORF Transcript_33308/g.56660 Transcript_33308/m.56660 type:complete len:226 (-) Transcript_33308:59-736(-)